MRPYAINEQTSLDVIAAVDADYFRFICHPLLKAMYGTHIALSAGKF